MQLDDVLEQSDDESASKEVTMSNCNGQGVHVANNNNNACFLKIACYNDKHQNC